MKADGKYFRNCDECGNFVKVTGERTIKINSEDKIFCNGNCWTNFVKESVVKNG